MEKPPATLRRDVQGREWTPQDVLMVAGKANLLPLLSAGGGLYNISKVRPARLTPGRASRLNGLRCSLSISGRHVLTEEIGNHQYGCEQPLEKPRAIGLHSAATE